MARTILILCDIHLNEKDEQVPAIKEETIAFGTHKPRLLAVCEDCDAQYIEPLRQLVIEHGIIADSAPQLPGQKTKPSSTTSGNRPGDYSCLECGKKYNYLGSLRTHVKEKHDMTLAQMQAKHGTEGELALNIDPSAPAEVVTKECDSCDVVYTNSEDVIADLGDRKDVRYTSRPSQAVGVHKSQVHGYKGERKSKELASA